LNCGAVIRELSAYLDGELDASVRAELERHLEHCEDCRIVVDTTRLTIRITCDSQPVPLPAEVHDRLHAALAKRLRQGSA
jgi:anti-sigma factor RsiW